MKKLLFISALIILSACGKSSNNTNSTSANCAGLQSVGVWKSTTTSDVLTFSDQCVGTSVRCAETFTYTRPASNQTVTQLDVTASNLAAGCPTNGQPVPQPFGCNFAFADANTLTFSCFGTTAAFTGGLIPTSETYTRQ